MKAKCNIYFGSNVSLSGKTWAVTTWMDPRKKEVQVERLGRSFYLNFYSLPIVQTDSYVDAAFVRKVPK